MVRKEGNYLIDDNNNCMTIALYESEEEARRLLEELKNCRDCSDCSDCRDCCYCSDCRDCRDCSACSACSDCSDCRYCSDCSDCRYCSDCRVCRDCRDCNYCSDCSDCRACRACRACSDCRACSYCSYCSYCSDCNYCRDRSGKNKEKTFPPVPAIQNIHQRIYEAASAPGCLDMDRWHKCETAHCRAGWAVHLAGEAGYKLENQCGPVFAAMQIYKASGYRISPNKFFASNEEALEDMKRLAEEAL